MHFSLTNRLTCLVLLLASTIVSSMSQEICPKLRDQHEKIRVLGEVYGGTTLLIITTSGHMFELDLNSTIRRHSSQGYYYLNISQEPSRHVKKEWSNVQLDLSENTNVLYSLIFAENFNTTILAAVFKTKPLWNDCLYSAKCRLLIELGQTVKQSIVDEFANCKAIANEDDYAFVVSRSCIEMANSECRIVFQKPKHSKVFCDKSNYFCFKPKDGATVLTAFYLAKPHQILVFIYSSGLVDIRKVDTFPSNQAKAPEPNWTITISEFIQCGFTKSGLYTLKPMSTNPPSNLQIYYWILMFFAILFVIVILVLYLIKMHTATSDSSRVKKRKKKKKKKKHSPSTVNTRTLKGDIPSGSPATVSSSSPKESSTGLEFLTAKGSTLKGPSTASVTVPANRSSQAKSSDLKFLTAQVNSATGSSTDLKFATAQGSCLKGSTTGSSLSLAQGSSSMGSSILKKPSFGDTTLSSAFGSTPSSSPTNVNSKASAKQKLTKVQDCSPAGSSISPTLSITKKSNSRKGSLITLVKTSSEVHSPKKSSLSTSVGTTSPTNAKSKAKRTLATKKQSMGKWIAGLLWAKEKKKNTRNKDKRKDPKKDSEKK